MKLGQARGLDIFRPLLHPRQSPFPHLRLLMVAVQPLSQTEHVQAATSVAAVRLNATESTRVLIVPKSTPHVNTLHPRSFLEEDKVAGPSGIL